MSTDGTDQARAPPVPACHEVRRAAPGAGRTGAGGVPTRTGTATALLLDHAAERGLLSPAEYQARLAELAEATPWTSCGGSSPSCPPSPADRPAAPARTAAADRGADVGRAAPDPPAPSTRRCGPACTPAEAAAAVGQPVAVLAVVVVVLLVALVALALVAAHVAHAHAAGRARAAAVAQSPSPLRNCSSSAAISSPLGRSEANPSGVPSSESMAASSRRTISRWSGLAPISSSTWTPGRLAGRAQLDGVEHRAGHGAQPLDEGGAGLGVGHGRHVVGDPGPQADDRDAGRPEGHLERGLHAGGHLERARGRCRPVRPGRPTPAGRWRPAAPVGCGAWAPGRRRGRPRCARPSRRAMPDHGLDEASRQRKSGSGPVR